MIVIFGHRAAIGELRDTMPHKHAITNGCGIDLNPGFAAALGLHPPFKVPVTWAWADDEDDPPSDGWFARIPRFLSKIVAAVR